MRKSFLTSKLEKEVIIIADQVQLQGNLTIPSGAAGLVLFAHGSGSSRFSPRNQFVAKSLQQVGLATLLFDLLTTEEEQIDLRDGRLRFNIPLLAERLVGATNWCLKESEIKDLNMGYFGASTGAAAALIAAASLPDNVQAVVSRGGRPDLANTYLTKVKSPTLLIVGGYDIPVIQMNESALAKLQGIKKLVIVPEATHLFEEPGKLEEVARHASDWFCKYL